MEVCHEQNLQWVQDPTNNSTMYTRNVIRQVLREEQHLVPGLLGLVETCDNARTALDREGRFLS